ncbi:MAG: hypothetical protein FWD33_03625 [Alphaproteobacteria bacterium]|nr:hypothetical protein [Alphaproteobacteria bacterium]
MRKLLVLLFALALTGAHANPQSYFLERTVHVIPREGECVGRNDDPMCVFDTVVACVIRQERGLCEKVGVKYSSRMHNALGHLAGHDYRYAIVDLHINRRNNVCSIEDGQSCVTNLDTGELTRVDMVMRDNRNFSVYMKRERNNRWSVIFATQYACWPDEDCS